VSERLVARLVGFVVVSGGLLITATLGAVGGVVGIVRVLSGEGKLFPNSVLVAITWTLIVAPFVCAGRANEVTPVPVRVPPVVVVQVVALLNFVCTI
jgi:hypothetical protein